MRGSPSGRSGIGLLAFAVLAIVLIIVVAAVAFEVGHQVAMAQRALGIVP
jgi:Flp pilus assembly protein TadG